MKIDNRNEFRLCIISLALPILAALLTIYIFITDGGTPDDWFSVGFRSHFFAFLGGGVSLGAAIGTIFSVIAFIRLMVKRSNAWPLYILCNLAPIIMAAAHIFGSFFDSRLP